MHWSSSGGIIDTLNGLLEKGETQLNTATETETTNKNNFDQLKQSLTDEIKFANKDMDDAKKGLAESAEIKAAAEGDLDVTTKALNEDLHALGNLHMDCMTKAQDFEAKTTSRGEELKALAMAKKAVVENTSGAGGQTFSFMQISTSLEDGVERFNKQECNTQPCVGDEICIAQQDLLIAADGFGSIREDGFNTLENYMYALALLSKAPRLHPSAMPKTQSRNFRLK